MILRELIVKLGLLVKDGDFAKADAKIDKVKKAGLALAGIFVSGAVAKGLTELVNHISEMGDQTAKAAQRTGIGVQALQELQYAADLANVSAEELNGGLKFLAKNSADAAGGGKEAHKAFAALGVQVKDAHGQLRPTEDVLLDVADGLSKIPQQGKRVELSMALMGRSGSQLLTLLQDGRGTIEAARKEFRELGGGFTEAEAKRMEEYRDNLTRMDRVFTRIKISIVTAIMPAFELVVGGLIKVGKFVNNFLKGTKFLEAAFLTLGIAAAVMGAKLIIAFAVPIGITLAWAAAIFLVILIVEELLATFDEGTDSLGKRWAGFIDDFIKGAEDGGTAWGNAGRAIAITFFDTQGAVQTAIDFYSKAFGEFWTWLKTSATDAAQWLVDKLVGAKDYLVKAIAAIPGIGRLISNTVAASGPGSDVPAPLPSGGDALVLEGPDSRSLASTSKQVTNAPTFNMELSVNGTDTQTATEIANNLADQIDERLQSHLDNAFQATVR